MVHAIATERVEEHKQPSALEIRMGNEKHIVWSVRLQLNKYWMFPLFCPGSWWLLERCGRSVDFLGCHRCHLEDNGFWKNRWKGEGRRRGPTWEYTANRKWWSIRGSHCSPWERNPARDTSSFSCTLSQRVGWNWDFFSNSDDPR